MAFATLRIHIIVQLIATVFATVSLAQQSSPQEAVEAVLDPLTSIGSTIVESMESGTIVIPPPPIPIADPAVPPPNVVTRYYEYVEDIRTIDKRWSELERQRNAWLALSSDLDRFGAWGGLMGAVPPPFGVLSAGWTILNFEAARAADRAAADAGRIQEGDLRRSSERLMLRLRQNDNSEFARISELPMGAERDGALEALVKSDDAFWTAIDDTSLPPAVKDELLLRYVRVLAERFSNYIVMNESDKAAFHASIASLEEQEGAIPAGQRAGKLAKQLADFRAHTSKQFIEMRKELAQSREELVLVSQQIKDVRDQTTLIQLGMWETMAPEQKLRALETGWFPGLKDSERQKLVSNLSGQVKSRKNAQEFLSAAEYVRVSASLYEVISGSALSAAEKNDLNTITTVLTGVSALYSQQYLTAASLFISLFSPRPSMSHADNSAISELLVNQRQLLKELRQLREEVRANQVEILGAISRVYVEATETKRILVEGELLKKLNSCRSVIMEAPNTDGIDPQKLRSPIFATRASREAFAQHWLTDIESCASLINDNHRVLDDGPSTVLLTANISPAGMRRFENEIYKPTLELTKKLLKIGPDKINCYSALFGLLTRAPTFVDFKDAQAIQCTLDVEISLKDQKVYDFSGRHLHAAAALDRYIDPLVLEQLVHASSFLFSFKRVHSSEFMSSNKISTMISPTWFRGLLDLTEISVAQQNILAGSVSADLIANWLINSEKRPTWRLPLAPDVKPFIASMRYQMLNAKYLTADVSPTEIPNYMVVHILIATDQQIVDATKVRSKNPHAEFEFDDDAVCAIKQQPGCLRLKKHVDDAIDILKKRKGDFESLYAKRFATSTKSWSGCGVEDFTGEAVDLINFEVINCVLSRNPILAANVANRIAKRRFWPAKMKEYDFARKEPTARAMIVLETQISESEIAAHVASKFRYLPTCGTFKEPEIYQTSTHCKLSLFSAPIGMDEFKLPENFSPPARNWGNFLGLSDQYLDRRPRFVVAHILGGLAKGTKPWESISIELPQPSAVSENMLAMPAQGVAARAIREQVKVMNAAFSPLQSYGAATSSASRFVNAARENAASFACLIFATNPQACAQIPH